MHPTIQSAQRPRRTALLWVVFILVLAAAGTGGALFIRAGEAKSASERKAGEAALTLEFGSADVALVEIKPLARSIAISGSLVPVIQSVVKSTVAGDVAKMDAREGESIRSGDVLAEIANGDLRSRLDAALADQEERRARLALALTNRNTNQALLKQNFISKNAFDQTQGTLEAAEAAVRWADAQVKLANKALADAVIRAPISGRIAKRMVNAGERVGADSPIALIVDLAKLELEVSVPASDVPAIRIGQRVEFKVDGYGERRFEGRVDRVNPVTEAASRAIKLFVAVPNGDSALKGGMFAEGVLTLSQFSAAPVVPISAVFEEAGQSYVFALEGGKLVKPAVTLGLKDEATGLAEVTSGLKPGAQVVRVRMLGLRVGQPALLKPPPQRPA